MQSQILKGSIPAGTALAEVSVAEMFNVARPTAKAAIEQLVQIGLLRRTRNKTARVPLLNVADVADLYLARGAVESAVTRLLAERGEVPPGAVEALARFRAAIDDSQMIAALVQADVDFHRALVLETGSPRLRRLHDMVMGEAHLCMAQVQTQHLLDPRVIADEHARILAAIEARDMEQAEGEMDAHIFQARNRLLAYLQQEESVAEDAERFADD